MHSAASAKRILDPADLPTPDVIRFAKDNQTFSAVGGFIASEYELTEAGETFHARAERVSTSRSGMHIMIRTTGDPSALAVGLEKTVHQLDPLLAYAFLAGWLPARRAAAIDPMQTLRAD